MAGRQAGRQAGAGMPELLAHGWNLMLIGLDTSCLWNSWHGITLVAHLSHSKIGFSFSGVVLPEHFVDGKSKSLIYNIKMPLNRCFLKVSP